MQAIVDNSTDLKSIFIAAAVEYSVVTYISSKDTVPVEYSVVTK